MKYSIEELTAKKEDQTYDRKSARKEAKGLSNHIVAFANADGGLLVIGIEDNGEITGIDSYTEKINEILRVPFDFCKPSVLVETEILECVDKNNRPNHLLLIKIPQKPELHANQQDDVYYRMGDKSQKLSFDDRLRLMYSKGSRYYEDDAFMLNVTIRNSIGATSVTSGATFVTSHAQTAIQPKLSENELLVYRFIKINPESSTRIIANNIKLSIRTVQRCIATLLEKGIIENRGTRQHANWFILKQP